MSKNNIKTYVNKLFQYGGFKYMVADTEDIKKDGLFSTMINKTINLHNWILYDMKEDVIKLKSKLNETILEFKKIDTNGIIDYYSTVDEIKIVVKIIDLTKKVNNEYNIANHINTKCKELHDDIVSSIVYNFSETKKYIIMECMGNTLGEFKKIFDMISYEIREILYLIIIQKIIETIKKFINHGMYYTDYKLENIAVNIENIESTNFMTIKFIDFGGFSTETIYEYTYLSPLNINPIYPTIFDTVYGIIIIYLLLFLDNKLVNNLLGENYYMRLFVAYSKYKKENENPQYLDFLRQYLESPIEIKSYELKTIPQKETAHIPLTSYITPPRKETEKRFMPIQQSPFKKYLLSPEKEVKSNFISMNIFPIININLLECVKECIIINERAIKFEEFKEMRVRMISNKIHIGIIPKYYNIAYLFSLIQHKFIIDLFNLSIGEPHNALIMEAVNIEIKRKINEIYNKNIEFSSIVDGFQLNYEYFI